MLRLKSAAAAIRSRYTAAVDGPAEVLRRTAGKAQVLERYVSEAGATSLVLDVRRHKPDQLAQQLTAAAAFAALASMGLIGLLRRRPYRRFRQP